MAYTLYHAKGCGSVAPLVALTVLNVPHHVVTLDYEETTSRKNKDTPEGEALFKANPLRQFPTLVTPDGSVMTEIAAILLYLAERHGKGTPWAIDALNGPQMAAFYRWMVFIPANLYPLITLIEFPERYVEVPHSAACPPEAVHGWVHETVSTRRKELFTMINKELVQKTPRLTGQYVLGTAMPTFLDIFLALVTHYAPHPRFSWLEEHCPELVSLVKDILKAPGIREVFVANELDDFVV